MLAKTIYTFNTLARIYAVETEGESPDAFVCWQVYVLQACGAENSAIKTDYSAPWCFTTSLGRSKVSTQQLAEAAISGVFATSGALSGAAGTFS